ncbi:MAG TPA: HD domain-containing protein, partial [Steroidobacteraceae bacterium]|jgi:tRNA nucleotidyltransferase (CCA-adding enzyme)
VPQPEKWHPEIDTGVHVMLALKFAARGGTSTAVRFATLLHDLGKGLTPRERWPAHPGHEEMGVPLVEAVARRLKAPKAHQELAVLAARHHTVVHRAFELKPATVLNLLETTDALRRPDRFSELLLACEADARGREGLEARPYPQADYLRHAREVASQIALSEEERHGLEGPAIGARIREKRLAALTTLKQENIPQSDPRKS